MITFTDDRLYAKGTCNIILSDVTNGNIYYQDNKTSTGSISVSTNLNEIRAGLGNPIAAMIPSDSDITVDFDSAAFSLWVKAAQAGAIHDYGAPVPKCQVIVAASETLTITDGVPVAKLGASKPICFVQEVGAGSFLDDDNVAYSIDDSNSIVGFTADVGKSYKVWYDVQNPSAEIATISSLIDPKVVRFEAQIAVYSNKSGGSSQGTRVGWIYLHIPYLKMQGDATISGDQGNNDTTKISGHAVAYEPSVVSSVCSDCDMSTLAYYVYSPDDAASNIKGLVVVGGLVEVTEGSEKQIPVRLVAGDGSLVVPSSYGLDGGFTYALATGGSTYASVSTAGVVSGTAEGDTEVTVTYTIGEETFTCPVNISVAAEQA